MITKYINYLREVRNLSENTLKAYENDIRAFAHWGRPQGLTWRTVTKQDIDRWTASRHEGTAAASIKRSISSLRCFMRWMKNEGMLPANAAQFCQSPRQESKLPECADLGKLTDYLSTAANTYESRTIHAMVALMKETGIRIQEAIDMRTEDFDLESRSIKIHGKGRKERIVYYTDGLLQHLAPVANMREGYILPTSNQYELRLMFYRELHKNGLSSTHPHAIRHGWATSMLNRGADINVVSFLLGHASVKTTERYARISNETARNMYNQLNN